MKFAILLSLAISAATLALPAHAAEFHTRKSVTLKVGQSTVLKGVRGGCKDKEAPSWKKIAGKLPKSKTGSFSDAGAGTTHSKSCNGEVQARGVRYTAKSRGTETLTIYKDKVKIEIK